MQGSFGPISWILVQGDITKSKVDAIVNAANSGLLGGGGVDGAIHRAAGPALMDRLTEIRRALPKGLPAGECVITPGERLPAHYVIHTVGPIWSGGNQHEPDLLAACYRNSLKMADRWKCTSVAIPAISTGVYGFPKKQASEIVRSTMEEVANELQSVRNVQFVLFSEDDFAIYRSTFLN